jgi:aspartyl-tRNA(Asn)/glutamyl-tRNA(Gln) amidotransferase subunit A
MTDARHELTIAEAGRLLRKRQLTARELTLDSLQRISEHNPLLHAFVAVAGHHAIEQAQRADQELRAGLDRGPLHGIPYALKDICSTKEIPTTCQSRVTPNWNRDVDCAVQEKLSNAGAILLGKLATHEFAIGGPSFDLPFPPARNPWNPDYFTGASSSGAGAAVAAGLVRIAIGSDTSGSIRTPACYCGTVGMKPTYGLVSSRGLFPLSFSLDHCGPLTWTVEDAALVLGAIAGYDSHDPASEMVDTGDFTRRIAQGVRGARIGLIRNFISPASAEVAQALESAASKLSELGAEVDEVDLPDLELFEACGKVIMMAEAYTIHEEDLRRRPMDYGRYTYQRIIAGAGLSAADFVQASRLRRELSVTVNKNILLRYEALIAPVSLVPTPRLSDFPEDWPPPKSVNSTATIPFNVTGNPALALPIGFSRQGLPLGMQVVGRAFDEENVFRIGAAYEQATQWKARRPVLPAMPV